MAANETDRVCKFHEDTQNQIRTKVPWTLFAILLPVFLGIVSGLVTFLYSETRRLEDKHVTANALQIQELRSRVATLDNQFGILTERMLAVKDILSSVSVQVQSMHTVMAGLNDRIDSRIESLDRLNTTIDKYLKIQKSETPKP